MRRSLDVAERDSLEIFVEGDRIILKKYESACVFCGKTKHCTQFNGKTVCAKCLDELKSL